MFYRVYNVCKCFVYQYFTLFLNIIVKSDSYVFSQQCSIDPVHIIVRYNLLKNSTYYLSNMYFVLFCTVDCAIGTPSVCSSEKTPPWPDKMPDRNKCCSWRTSQLWSNTTRKTSDNQEETHTHRGKHVYANINHPHEGYLTLTSICRKPVACTAGEATDSLQPRQMQTLPIIPYHQSKRSL